ncbi:MAG: hypothetical protein BWZ07_03153 [Alphaproteobacteria bacterium ADurb.BinA280]|nr:MAG: hypothetical protein BWZ07_03153 [Alphaproteobacteria bacterium ADurb.BinA280]
MVPAEPDGALAEIVFLAVALGKCGNVEQAHGIQHLATDQHAKAIAGWQLRIGMPGILPCCAGRLGVAPAWRKGIFLFEFRNRKCAGVVGNRRCRGHVRRAVQCMAQTDKPVCSHLGIGIEQDHVCAGRHLHAAVDRCRESQVARVFVQFDAIP